MPYSEASSLASSFTVVASSNHRDTSQDSWRSPRDSRMIPRSLSDVPKSTRKDLQQPHSALEEPVVEDRVDEGISYAQQASLLLKEKTKPNGSQEVPEQSVSNEQSGESLSRDSSARLDGYSEDQEFNSSSSSGEDSSPFEEQDARACATSQTAETSLAGQYWEGAPLGGALCAYVASSSREDDLSDSEYDATTGRSVTEEDVGLSNSTFGSLNGALEEKDTEEKGPSFASSYAIESIAEEADEDDAHPPPRRQLPVKHHGARGVIKPPCSGDDETITIDGIENELVIVRSVSTAPNAGESMATRSASYELDCSRQSLITCDSESDSEDESDCEMPSSAMPTMFVKAEEKLPPISLHVKEALSLSARSNAEDSHSHLAESNAKESVSLLDPSSDTGSFDISEALEVVERPGNRSRVQEVDESVKEPASSASKSAEVPNTVETTKSDMPDMIAETDAEDDSMDNTITASDDEEGRKWGNEITMVFSSNSTTPKTPEVSAPVTPISRIPYVHGSYASAAPQMLQDVKWMRILRRLLPASHADAMEIMRAEQFSSRASRSAPQAARIMKWAENNPVVAAYGIMNSDSGRESSRPGTTRSFSGRVHNELLSYRGISTGASDKGILPALEWDVFLDPTLVKKADAAINAAHKTQNDPEADYQEQIAADIEVDRQIGRLITRMMLAHGSAPHLVAEALGVGSQYNFTKLVEEGESQRLYRRRESERVWKRSGLHFSRNGMDLGGKTWLAKERLQLAHIDPSRRSVVAGKTAVKPSGIFVERWLALFLRAINLAKAADDVSSFFSPEDDESSPKLGDETTVKTKPPFCGMFLCFGIADPNSAKTDHGTTSMADTAKQIHKVLGSPLRVILDLKSRRVPPRVWARVIDNMRSRGIIVEGLGSFDIDELRSITSLCASRVRAVRFFHSAGDLQKACHAQEVHIGDTVFFNAGSLIWENRKKLSTCVCGTNNVSHAVLDEDDDFEQGVRFQPFAYPSDYGEEDVRKLQCQATLQEYKEKFKLNIGCYVQEFSISLANLDALITFLNKYTSIYNLGLAWGGLNGQGPVGLNGDGYWNQRYMGRAWENNAKPTDDMRLLQPEDHPLVQKAIMAGAWGHIGTINMWVEEDSPEKAALDLGAVCAPPNTTCG